MNLLQTNRENHRAWNVISQVTYAHNRNKTSSLFVLFLAIWVTIQIGVPLLVPRTAYKAVNIFINL